MSDRRLASQSLNLYLRPTIVGKDHLIKVCYCFAIVDNRFL